jgi:single-strand DNA-binding protein
MNKVFIIGRLVRDAELKYAGSGMAVSKFSLACNEKRKAGDEWVDEVSYFDAVLFGKTAESLTQYLVKGKRIAVDGKLKQERWEDRDTGKARSRVSVTALNIQLLDSGSGGGGEGHGGRGNEGAGYAGNARGGYNGGGYGGPANGPAPSRPPAPPPPADDGFIDDIPF